jgi:ADP-heptose:LPS heptosyltransferase
MAEGQERKQRVLIVRADRIGDLVISTPVFQAVKVAQPDTEVVALVQESCLPIVKHNPYVSETIAYAPRSVHKGLAGWFRLVREIRRYKFDTAVVLQSQFGICAAIWVARVRRRIGPYSKWYSYLFFNRGVFQRRSRVEMHEADYNLMLLRRMGLRIHSRQFSPHIVVDGEAKERMRTWLRDEGFTADERFVIVHPGMGGSALNWPEGYYVDLVALLAARGTHVVITGSVAEKDLVGRVLEESLGRLSKEGAGKVRGFRGAASHTGLDDLIALQSLSSLVVAPSTGPLHIATALGKSTVSFYPPIKVQSALRWGPYHKEEERHSVLVPDALCGQDFKCAGKRCTFYFCMERLGVEEAVSQVFQQLAAAPRNPS